MGTQIDELPHSCGTKTAFKVFAQEDGTVDGFCYACATWVKDPYGDGRQVGDLPPRKVKTDAERVAEVAEVDGYPTVTVKQRGLRQHTLEQFGAKVSLSEVDGQTPTAIYWPITKDGHLTGYHVKPLWEKGFPYNIGDTKGNVDLIGWEQAKVSGAYRLIITEGPEDMASVARIFEQHGNSDYSPAVCSLPHGAGSARGCIGRHLRDLFSTFKEVVLNFDADEAGRKAVQQTMLLDRRFISVELPLKDANECLLAGAGKAAYHKFFNATTPKNTRLVMASTLHEKARTAPKYGELSWPFPKLNEAVRGLRLGETGYIGAGVKMGKGELRNELAAHFIINHGIKVFMASFEESNEKSYKLVAGKAVSRFFHDPKRPFDTVSYDRAGTLLDDRLILLNIYQHVDWSTLRSDIIAAAGEGAKAVFIDPITNLTNGENAGDANSQLQQIAQDMAALALDHGLLNIMFCHLKAPEGQISPETRLKEYGKNHYIGLGNCPHEMGGEIHSTQFAGSRAMMRSCNWMVGLEGNTDPALPIETRNVRHLKLLEDREFGERGIFPIYWDHETGRFTEI